MDGKASTAVIVPAQDLNVGDIVRPSRGLKNPDACDPAFTTNFSSILDGPIYSVHGYNSFVDPLSEIFFVLEIVKPMWHEAKRARFPFSNDEEVDMKFLAATSQGVCVIWVYTDEAFEIIGD